MTRLSTIFCVGYIVFGVLIVPAQSGQRSTNSSGKTNQRPAATPSPTPVETSPETNEPTIPDDGEIITINTQLVSIPVRVMDKKNRFVAGLKKENFRVLEGGVEQEVALFSNEHQPFTVALMLDMSYSTKFKIAEIQAAAITFIDQLRPQDKVMVTSFDGEVRILCEVTNDRKTIYEAIKSTKIETGTSLYEAVDVVMNDRLRRIEGRKAIILFTDGVDTTSRRVTDFQNLNDALELDALIYTIRYDTYADVQAMKNKPATAPPPISIPTQGSNNPFPAILASIGTPGDQGTTAEEYQHAEEYLDQLALRTGGRTYVASSLVNLADAFTKIASELREFYSIGYYPKEDRVEGKKTNIKVRVDQPGLVVKSREGYLNLGKNDAKKR